MAIDRQVVWVYQRLTTMPHINPGFSYATAAEKAILDAQGVAGPGYDDERRRVHIKRIPPKVPV